MKVILKNSTLVFQKSLKWQDVVPTFKFGSEGDNQSWITGADIGSKVIYRRSTSPEYGYGTIVLDEDVQKVYISKVNGLNQNDSSLPRIYSAFVDDNDIVLSTRKNGEGDPSGDAAIELTLNVPSGAKKLYFNIKSSIHEEVIAKVLK